jgi:HEAT repeat protein
MQQVVCPHCGRQIDARSLSGAPPLACPTCARRFYLPDGATLASHSSWSDPVAEGGEVIYGIPAEEIVPAAVEAAAEEPPGSRMLVYALAGLAAFLIALIAVVVAARQLRPVIVGPDDSTEKPLAEWIKQLRETKDAGQRRAAAEAIVSLGPAAVLETLAAITAPVGRDGMSEFSQPVVRALAETGPQSAAMFGEALGSEKENVRAAAARVLREMGSKAVGAVAPLAKALADDNRWVRWAATEALGNIGPAAAPAVEALLPLVTHYDYLTRRRAATTLGRIGPAAKSAVPVLKHAEQKDSDPEVRKLAAFALHQVDLAGVAAAATAQASQEVRELIVRMQSADETASVAAANALAKIGTRGKDAVPALALALTSDRKWLRVAAAEALGAMGREARNVVPALQQAAQSDDRDLRDAAQAALERIDLNAPATPASR